MTSNIWKIYDDEFIKQKKEEDVEKIDSCKKCNNILKIGENGFYCCSNNKCGIMYKDKLDMGAEWRFYGADDNKVSDPSRCGMPINPLLQESSFGCKITCNSNSSYEMKKIRRYTEWLSMPYKEKSKYEAFQIITTHANQAGIPKIFIESAIRYYNIISNNKTYRGLNRDGLLAASVYIAFSANNNARTAKEIASIFNLDTSSATKGCKNALNILNDIEEHSVDKTELETTTPDSFIHRYCSKLGINSNLTELCYIIAIIVWKKGLISENTPHSISTGIIYYVCQKCNLNISKLDIHNYSKISEVTINKCYKRLESIESQFLPPEIKTKYNIV
jgi:transcription initiation factor TFIIB